MNSTEVKRKYERLLDNFSRDRRIGRVIVDDFNPENVDEYSQHRRDEVTLWDNYSRELEAIEGNYHEDFLNQRAYYVSLREDEAATMALMKKHNFNRYECGASIRKDAGDATGKDSMYSIAAIMELIE